VIGFLRIVGILNAAVWFGAAVFFTFGAGFAPFSAEMKRLLGSNNYPYFSGAIAQILINSRMCAEGHRPICQDTGIVVAFLSIGMDVRWDAELSVSDMVNEGVRRLADEINSYYNDRPITIVGVPLSLNPLKARKPSWSGGA